MANGPLLELDREVARALLAGGSTAVQLLEPHRQPLSALARQVPALQPLAEQLARSAEGPAQLLDLAVMVRRVNVAQAGPGNGSGLSPLSGAEPMATPLLVADVARLQRALTVKGEGPLAAVWEALEQKQVRDLRLLSTWLAGLADPRAGDNAGQDDRSLAEVIADEVLPLLGEAAAPVLQRELDIKGNAVDGRRLKCLTRIRGKAVRQLVLDALDKGTGPVRLAALNALAEIDPEVALERAHGLITTDKAEDVRAAAARLVAASPAGLDLDTLIDRLHDKAFQLILADALKRHPVEQVVDRLVTALTPEALGRPGTDVGGMISLFGLFPHPKSLQALVKLWQSSPNLRYYAGHAILKYVDPAATEMVAQAIRDGQTEYLQAAKVALNQMDPGRAYELFSSCIEPQCLGTAEGSRVARAVLEGATGQELWGIDDKNIRPPDPRWLDRCRELLAPERLKQDQRDPARTAVVALGKWDADRSLPLLVDLVRTCPNEAISNVAAQVLLQLKRPEGLEVLAGRLDSEDVSVQQNAIAAIFAMSAAASFRRLAYLFEPASLGTPQGLELATMVLNNYRQLVKDPDEAWIGRCLDLLARIGEWQDHVQVHDLYDPVQVMTNVMRRWPDPRWVPALLRALDALEAPAVLGTPQERLRRALLTALWQLDDPRAVDGVRSWAKRAQPNNAERDTVQRMLKWLNRDRSQPR